MFEDIITTPKKRIIAKKFKIKVARPAPKTLVEQIREINDLRQLIKILEVTKIKVSSEKLKLRRSKKLKKKIK